MTVPTKRKGSPEADTQPPERPRKSVRISDFSCGAEVAPASTPHAKRSKQKEEQRTPYLDLRKMASSKRATNPDLEYEALDASGARKIAWVFYPLLKGSPIDYEQWSRTVSSAASAEVRRAMESAVGGSPRISVSLALEILRDIPVDNVVRFKPGQRHEGKEFRCRFVSQDVVPRLK